MSSFGGQDLFGSGPHRFIWGERGQDVVRGTNTSGETGSEIAGVLEAEVTVRGRLVGASEADLHARRAALVAEAESGVAKTLLDGAGRSTSSMTLITYREDGPAEQGRTWSVEYEAVFRRIA